MLCVGIVGSRGYPNLDEVERFVWALARKYPDCLVISGGAPDVDNVAEEAARTARLRVRSYRPTRRAHHFEILMIETGRFAKLMRGFDEEPLRYKTFAKAAMARNSFIVNDSDELAAFHWHNSRGTADSIRKAREAGIGLHIYQPGTPPISEARKERRVLP